MTVPIAAYAMTAGAVAGDNDGNPTNELQSLTFNPNNNSLAISQGNNVDLTGLKNDADADPANEIQTISLDTTNNEILLSKGGGSILLPSSGNSLWKKMETSYRTTIPTIFIKHLALLNTKFLLAILLRKVLTASRISGEKNLQHCLRI